MIPFRAGRDERDWLARTAARAAWVIGVAAPVFGMSACLSANSLVYLCVGLLMVLGIWAYMREPAAKLGAAVTS